MDNWKSKFLIIGTGQAISILSSSILQIAIVWYLTQRTQSAAVVTTASLVGFLPRGILGLFTGSFVDRFNRKAIVVLADLVMALGAVVLAVVALFSELPILLIYAMLFIRSVGSAFHTPALSAIIPSIVPRDQLARCAGLLEGFESLSLLLSPAIAAVLFDVWSLSAIIMLDVAGAVLATAILLLTPIPKSGRSSTGEPLRILRDTAEGLRVLRTRPGMMALTLVGTLYAFIYFPIGSMYPLITMTYFGGSIQDSSFVEIAFSAGSLAGAFLLSLWGHKFHKIIAIAMSIGLYGVGAIGIGMLPPSGLRLLMVFSVVMGITIPFFYGLRTAIFQEAIPDAFLGRALSFTNSVSLFTGPLGLAFGGFFSDHFGVNTCFLVLGVLSAALGLAMVVMPSVRNCLTAEEQPESGITS